MLEIEKRGFLTEEKYHELIGVFEKHGVDLGQDNKEVIYYIYPDKLLKAVHNISKKNSKISLKTNKIGQGAIFPETEIIFNEKDFGKMKLILDNIATPETIMSGIQKRRNFEYKGCEFALKWSREWGYHFEVEKLVADESQVKDAELALHAVSDELGIHIMTEEELQAFTKEAETYTLTNYRDQLLSKAKAKHQENDSYSVEWIEVHRPEFIGTDKKVRNIYLDRVLAVRPWEMFRDDFYASERTLLCVHGRNHAIRVAINMLMLAAENNAELEVKDMIFAALFHDCSRVNDNADLGHGERSAKRLAKYADLSSLGVQDLDKVLYAIGAHDLDYQQFEESGQYAESKSLVDLLKSADALDRYRFPRDDWWLREEYIRINPSDTIREIAFSFVYHSEKNVAMATSVDYEVILTTLKAS